MRLEVGRIDKPHGVHGDVLVTLTSDRVERVAPGAVFEHDGGTFTVQSSRPHQRRFIVNFSELTNREQAQEARGTVLYGEPIDDPDVLWVHDLIDQPVVDLDGRDLGRVGHVEENPASDLLALDSGGLVPLAFFVEQQDDGTIVVDPPVGLFGDEDEEE
ncbi:MAG: ribosome maturation factor RimM [Actinomycetota bacterium]